MAAYKRFFLNGHLHRVLHTGRAKNELTAFDFIDGKIKVYPYSDVQRRKQNAIRVNQLADMLNRHRKTIHRYIQEGSIPRPQQEYAIHTGKPGAFFFSEDDAMAVRDFLSTIHYGRTRADGKNTPYKVPTREELRAMIDSGKILYVKEDNEFVPIWRAQNW
jgi:hypothetical protein